MCNICAASGSQCYNPEWEVYLNQNSAGATQYSVAESVQECLDYCGSQSRCVAVDVEMAERPLKCWPHFSAVYSYPGRVHSQRGTNQYRLRERCATGPVTGFICLTTLLCRSLRHNRISIAFVSQSQILLTNISCFGERWWLQHWHFLIFWYCYCSVAYYCSTSDKIKGSYDVCFLNTGSLFCFLLYAYIIAFCRHCA